MEKLNICILLFEHSHYIYTLHVHKFASVFSQTSRGPSRFIILEMCVVGQICGARLVDRRSGTNTDDALTSRLTADTYNRSHIPYPKKAIECSDDTAVFVHLQIYLDKPASHDPCFVSNPFRILEESCPTTPTKTPKEESSLQRYHPPVTSELKVRISQNNNNRFRGGIYPVQRDKG